VVIPPEIKRELQAHAREEAPNEACGLLLLRDGRAERYERGRNAVSSPYRFELDIDPEVWFAEDEGYELAVFHSHPAGPPRPSRTDIERIGLWEGRPYLILRLDTGEIGAWRIREGSFEEEPLEEV
jgi:desampylase